MLLLVHCWDAGMRACWYYAVLPPMMAWPCSCMYGVMFSHPMCTPAGLPIDLLSRTFEGSKPGLLPVRQGTDGLAKIVAQLLMHFLHTNVKSVCHVIRSHQNAVM